MLAKHRKALMLFGTMHLFHSNNKNAPRGLESAVARYEVNYPGVTFVIGTAIEVTPKIETLGNVTTCIEWGGPSAEKMELEYPRV